MLGVDSIRGELFEVYAQNHQGLSKKREKTLVRE
jgi:hypothetical protein